MTLRGIAGRSIRPCRGTSGHVYRESGLCAQHEESMLIWSLVCANAS